MSEEATPNEVEAPVVSPEEVKEEVAEAVLPPKPEPSYELVLPNSNGRMATVRKIDAIDFKIDDLLNFIAESQSDKAKSLAQIEYNDAIIENIKGFHPEVVEYYDALPENKKTAFLLFAKAVTEREKHAYQVVEYKKEEDRYTAEIKLIETTLGIKAL